MLESEHVSSTDEYENADDSGIGLGHAGHSRRTSDIGILQQQSLPGVGHILSDAEGAYRLDGGYQYTA